MLITDKKYITPELITAIFRGNAILKGREGVAKLNVFKTAESDTWFHYYVSLQYADFRTQRHAPDKIFIKLSKPNADVTDREALYYNRVYKSLRKYFKPEELLVADCYDAYYEDVTQQAHVILEDISQAFKPRPEPEPPSPRHREQLVTALARFHAALWEHEQLSELSDLPNETAIEQKLELYQQRYAELDAFSGKHISKRQLEILQLVSAGYPDKRKERIMAGKGLTVVHGDLSPDNILHSHNSSRIIDWKRWRVDTATDDLAYMMACHYPDSLLKFEERKLLQRYYDTLLQSGVKDYGYEDLIYDYRASLVECIGNLLIGWTKEGMMSGYWKSMETALNAFDGLRCAELFK